MVLKRIGAAAAIFAYAVLSPYQDQALLQPDRQPGRADLDQHVGQVVAAFLRAYAPDASYRVQKLSS